MLVQHIPRKSFAPKSAVAAKINFTPKSTLTFAGQDVKIGTKIPLFLEILRANRAEVRKTDTGFGYTNFEATLGNQKLILGGGGTKENPGSIQGFSVQTGRVIKTVTSDMVSVSKPVQLPKAYAKVFEEGLTLDVGSKKVKVNLGEDIDAVAKRFGAKAAKTIEGAGWGPGVIEWSGRGFVQPNPGTHTGFEFSVAGKGAQRHMKYTVLSGLDGKVDRIWANAETFPIGEIRFVNRIALENQGGKAELSLSDARSGIENGIVNRARTFTGNEGVEVLTRTGL